METYEVSQQFQQPSRLSHDEYDSETNIRAAENRFSYQYLDRRLEENWTKSHESEEENRYMNDDDEDDDSQQILKGFLKELDVKGHKMVKKLVSRVEKDVPIERILREILHDFRGKPGSDMLEKIVRKLNKVGGEEDFVSTERGVDGDILQENKLERFKVKTVNTIGSGVVKEEGQ